MEFAVTHQPAPVPCTVVVLRPAQAEPFYVGSPSWPVFVSAAVVGSGDEYDTQATAALDWYDYDSSTGSSTLLSSDTPATYLSLQAGSHTLIASAGAPFTGPQASCQAIVHEEMVVALGSPTVAGSIVTVPVTVTDGDAGVESSLEARVTAPDGSVRFTQVVSTDASGVGSVAFRATKPGTYAIAVDAHAANSMYGHAETTVSK